MNSAFRCLNGKRMTVADNAVIGNSLRIILTSVAVFDFGDAPDPT